jgi:hypothetical protein
MALPCFGDDWDSTDDYCRKCHDRIDCRAEWLLSKREQEDEEEEDDDDDELRFRPSYTSSKFRSVRREEHEGYRRRRSKAPEYKKFSYSAPADEEDTEETFLQGLIMAIVSGMIGAIGGELFAYMRKRRLRWPWRKSVPQLPPARPPKLRE